MNINVKDVDGYTPLSAQSRAVINAIVENVLFMKRTHEFEYALAKLLIDTVNLFEEDEWVIEQNIPVDDIRVTFNFVRRKDDKVVKLTLKAPAAGDVKNATVGDFINLGP